MLAIDDDSGQAHVYNKDDEDEPSVWLSDAEGWTTHMYASSQGRLSMVQGGRSIGWVEVLAMYHKLVDITLVPRSASIPPTKVQCAIFEHRVGPGNVYVNCHSLWSVICGDDPERKSATKALGRKQAFTGATWLQKAKGRWSTFGKKYGMGKEGVRP